jgi:phosphohistidine phosphatase
MSLRLFLLRHAKAEQAGETDLIRRLAPRGRDEAEHVATLLKAEGYQPQAILCSTSQRTRETLAPLIPVLVGGTEITLTHLIYNADCDDLLALVRTARAASLMLIGHNPGIEELAALLIGAGDQAAHTRLIAKFPPAGLAVIDFKRAGWTEVTAESGELVAFHVPA